MINIDPVNETICTIFERQVLANGDRIAVTWEDHSISYKALYSMCLSVTSQLVSVYGVSRGDVVAIRSDRNEFMIVGMLSVLMCGGTYVPVDKDLPEERVNYIVRQCAAKLILSDYNGYKNQEISLRRLVSMPAVGNISLQNAPNDSAYIIFTSGSTGTPKGVEIMHSSVVNLVISLNKKFSLKEHVRLLAVANFSFDMSVLDWYLPLLTGGCIDIVTREMIVDLGRLLSRLDESRPDIVQSTPSLWKLIVESGWKGNDSLSILIGGEMMSQDLCEKLLVRCLNLYNMYGPTETTVWSSFKQITSPEQYNNIGLPIDNTMIYIVDEKGDRVNEDFGDIWIGGDGVAKQYKHRPELTAQQFIDNPFSSKGRIYKTGDIGRFLKTGEIEIKGRRDSQVKVQGYRIELGEVEHAFLSHESIDDVIVSVYNDAHDDPHLVLYFVSAGTPEISTLKEHGMKTLPSYMMPSFYIRLESLPLNSNGKVDRKNLPAPVPDTKNVYSEDLDSIQKKVLTLCEDCLGRRGFSLDDNFFMLGGNSIKAMRLAFIISGEFRIMLGFNKVIEAESIRILASTVEAMSWLTSQSSDQNTTEEVLL